MRRHLARAQGLYYAATGIWSLVHMPSFLAVTGPKRDLWLVRTVGVLVLAIGAALMLAGRRDEVRADTVLLAAGSAAGLGAIEVVYAGRGRIRRVYLADAAVEAALVAAWGLVWAVSRHEPDASL